MRPLFRGDHPLDAHGAKIIFADYPDARGALIDRLGEYCSYCERRLPASLAVEHVQPKSPMPSLRREWTNFLLGCANCNSTKGDSSIVMGDYFWPDRDNTARAYLYTATGDIAVDTRLSAAEIKKAEGSLDLVGLRKKPAPSLSVSDRRFTHRVETWSLAEDALADLKLKTPPANVLRKHIVNEALFAGHFSIWMEVFANDEDMRRRFCHAFKGTAKDCFDAHMKPIVRPGGAL